MHIIEQPKREAVPALIALAGPSGSGKTFSALLLAAGLQKGGKIGFIDTENRRSSFYMDNPLIKEALPNGWSPLYLTDPFSPDRYTEALDAYEQAGGYDVVIIDSMTHEWEGFGGCSDIAENNKLGGNPNWAKAKLHHKRMMNKLLARPFHIIFCLRAREKVKQIKIVDPKTNREKMTYVDDGMQPIQEKNFKFEMLVASMLDERTKRPVSNSEFSKIPDQLIGIFAPDRYITIEDGRRIREWVDGGMALDMASETLKRDCRDSAHDGVQSLVKFWTSLTPDQQLKLGVKYKDECKLIAQEVDAQKLEQATANQTSDGGVF